MDHNKAAASHFNHEQDHTPEFFREVLLSYRLLFGQDKRSRKAFNSQLPTWNREWDCSGQQGSKTSDPMLLLLCGKSWESEGPRQIFEEISAEEPSEYYSPHLDFPHLSKRIRKCDFGSFMA